MYKLYLQRTGLSFFILFFLSGSLFSQSDSLKPVQFQFKASKKSAQQYDIIINAGIAPGWKLFSTVMKDEDPNSRVQFDSSTSKFATITGITESSNLQRKPEPLLDNLTIQYFENKAEWPVHTTVTGKNEDVKGTVTFMAIKGNEVIGPEEVAFRFSFDTGGNLVVKAAGLQESTEASGALKRSSIDLNNPVNKCGGTGAENSAGTSLWGIFALGFIGGLVGLIMPCTFPMIPLTVSFFTKKSGSRQKSIFNASMYGFFIFLIYVLLSTPFYFLGAGSSDILNNISTNAWLNIFFAVVFFVFALSFFGLFEITLPGGVGNSVDAKSNVSSLAGIFFMALTLAIVSFSCTGPILGTLLVGALNQDGGAVQLTVAMAGFGLALGLPFTLFALFPNWLSSLPRSGSWMTTVKIVFAFVELALMIKFLSNADLVMHWGLLKREVFFATWILIGLATTLYLFGILKFKHDPPPAKFSKTRVFIGLLFLAFTLYLVPGVTNTKHANRAFISGFPPPLTYSIYKHDQSKEKGVEANVVNDYEKALQLAKEQGKPILIDFTGWACVNCRKMEENVWTQPAIKDLIKENFVLVSLYVDDRKALPDAEQFVYSGKDGSKKKIETIGDKFITLQSENFQNASQPLYVVLSPDEKLLTLPVGYTPSAKEYEEWLKCGLEAFKK